MEAKISQLTIVVKDQAKALEFYTQKVGWEKRTDVTPPGSYRWVTVAPKGVELEIALWQVGSATDPTQAAWSREWAPARAPPVVLRVGDCKKAYEELHARGVPFVAPPKEYPWGIAATFQDPDGNLFSISQPAAWPKP